MAAKADLILEEVYTSLKLKNATDQVKYSKVNEIVLELEKLNKRATIHEKTTGTISERICELALRSTVSDLYKSITGDWNWMADFSVYGHPFNLLVSVKSFKAKERLLASGSGNNLSPIVGWGLFDDRTEWNSKKRIDMYLYRSFLAIYLPARLHKELPKPLRDIKNINGRPFLRQIDLFPHDLVNAVGGKDYIDVTIF